MRTFNTLSKGYKALLLVSSVSAIAVASPAYAQADDDEDTARGGDQIIVTGSRILRPDFENNSPTVTVDDEFLKQSSTAAIENQLNKLPQFVVSQSATSKNNEGGLVPGAGDIQPNSTNTPGAATVSLRGVGANRTLVLIDGRRGTPGNAAGTVDISTIPSSAIQRVDVVSGGASATYGADAVAGVTNFIIKKDFQGLELDGQIGFNEYGDGFEYQISGIMGADFDDGRGNVTIAMSTNDRNTAYERNRPWFRDNWDEGRGSNLFGFVPRPGVAMQATDPAVVASLFPGATGPIANNATFYANQDGSLFTDTFANRGGVAFFEPWPEMDEGYQYAVNSVGALTVNSTRNFIALPQTRYNFYGRGNYEINDWIGMFGQGMFSHTSTFTRQIPGNITAGWSANVPWGSGVYVGNAATPSSVIRNGDTFGFGPYVDATPGDLTDNPTNPAFTAIYGGANPILACANGLVGGCTNTQAFQDVIPDDIEALLNARLPDFFGNSQANAPMQLRALFPDDRETFTDVETYNMVAGFEGSIPDTDWTWDLSVNHGISITTARQTGIYSLERTRAVVSSPNFGQGFLYTGNRPDNGFGASTGACTSGFDFFDVQGFATNVSEDCREAIGADLSNKGTMRQTIAELNLQGKVFDLPAGELRAAVGAAYRQQEYQFVNDGLINKNRSFLDQAIGIYPAGNTHGQIDTKEVYGELLIPVLSDIPGIQQFNLEVGGRISDYNTTGTSYTYKVLGDWEVTDWLRIRGGYNRAERAPNIAELFLAPQQTFGFSSVGDLCSTLLPHPASANPNTNANSADTLAVCQALMVRDNNGVVPADNDPDGPGPLLPDGNPDFAYYGPIWGPFQDVASGGFSFGSVAGNTVYREDFDANTAPLKPEVADTWTLGAVITSPVTSGPLSRLRLSVDYFNIKIEDPIGSLSVGAAQQLCLDPVYNPAVAGAGAGGFAGAQAQEAIAFGACEFVRRNPDAAFFGGGLNSAGMTTTYRNDGLIKLAGIDWQLDWSGDVGPGSLFVNIIGNYMIDFKAKELDPNPLVDYVGTTGTGIKGLNIGSAYEYRLFSSIGYSYEGAMLSLQWQHTPSVENSPTPDNTTGLPSYNLFNLNGSYQVMENVSLRFGVDNLFNKRPPITGINTAADPDAGQTPGGSFSYLHDILGRRFSLGANVKF